MAWGSKAKTFFQTCVALAGDDRDIDLYHWSSERFSAAWRTTISVLVAKGRARVGVAAAATDWPKRIRDLQFLDHPSATTGLALPQGPCPHTKLLASVACGSLSSERGVPVTAPLSFRTPAAAPYFYGHFNLGT